MRVETTFDANISVGLVFVKQSELQLMLRLHSCMDSDGMTNMASFKARLKMLQQTLSSYVKRRLTPDCGCITQGGPEKRTVFFKVCSPVYVDIKNNVLHTCIKLFIFSSGVTLYVACHCI